MSKSGNNSSQYNDPGEMLYANKLKIDTSPVSHTAEGFPGTGEGSLGGMKDAFKGMIPGGDISAIPGLRDGISLFTEGGFDSALKGIFGAGAFNTDFFSCFDSMALGKLSFFEFWEMAKKSGLKVDFSIIKETGADLGVNLGIMSGGASQEH
jgi:hypothetical protein